MTSQTEAPLQSLSEANGRFKIMVTDISNGERKKISNKADQTNRGGSKQSTATQIANDENDVAPQGVMHTKGTDDYSSSDDEDIFVPPQRQNAICLCEDDDSDSFDAALKGVRAKGAVYDSSSDDEYVPPQRQNAILPCEDDDIGPLEAALAEMHAQGAWKMSAMQDDDCSSDDDEVDYVPPQRQHGFEPNDEDDLQALETAFARLAHAHRDERR
eukprot:TRINITY_DN20898_c0_g1_i1.p1 TRINITY_DN20898_c0_g1~~TRINITY_DN20898_c0_g1_i1.p1  ORF type:complete len:215 (-),score=53.12 TRINITY_DN20898_c0_g1_i1:202-846(-)